MSDDPAFAVALHERIKDPSYVADTPELESQVNKALALLVKIKQREEYMDKERWSYHTGENTLHAMDRLDVEMNNEISASSKRKDATYAKIKNKYLREGLRNIEKLVSYTLNTKVVTKFLSGNLGTVFSKMFYHSFNKGLTDYSNFNDRARNILKPMLTVAGYDRWSAFNRKKDTIDDLETVSVSTLVDTTSQDTRDVKLTKSELMTLYFNLRLDDSNAAINERGFVLHDTIDGRDIAVNETIQLAPGEDEKIMALVEADEDMMSIVGAVDNLMKFQYEQTNPVFRRLSGFNMDKIENYFPVYVGHREFEQRRAKGILEQFRPGRARLGQNKPVRVADLNFTLRNTINASSLYHSYALPVRNMKKFLRGNRQNYVGTPEERYFDFIEGFVNDIQDASLLYSNQGDKALTQRINQLTSNFAVSVLSWNVPVMMKQPVSYINAANKIDKRYLRQVGWGAGGVFGIKPGQIIKSLAFKTGEGSQSILPVEWQVDENDPTLQEIKELSPVLKQRLLGYISREQGEVLQSNIFPFDQGDDRINVKLPGMKKEKVISKNRLMEGIRVFDSATITSIWKAVKLETAELHPNLEVGSKAYNEHIAMRAEEIVADTQPTYDLIHRTELGRSQNPISRLITMFSSQRSKNFMLLVDRMVDFLQDPSKFNRKRMFSTYTNILVTSALALTAIDMLKTGFLYGFDDDDEAEFAITKTLSNNLGLIYVVGPMADLIMSRIDDKPWRREWQHPIMSTAGELADAVAYTIKGDFDKALWRGFSATAKFKGLPLQAILLPKQLGKNYLGFEY